MTIDQYRNRLTLLTYKIFKKVEAKKIPASVYYTVYWLAVEEIRRAS